MPTIKKGVARVYGYEEKANKDQLNGYPSLDAGGKIPVGEIPNLSATYLPLIGGTMSGQIDYSYLYFNMGFQAGIQDTEYVAGQPKELSFYDQLNTATGSRQKTLNRLAMPGLLPETMFPADVGKIWNHINALTADSLYTSCYLGNGIVIIGDSVGHIWRSASYGINWDDLGAIAGANVIRSSCYLGNGIVIIGTDNGHIWRSTDFGVNWTDLGAIVGATSVRALCYLGDGIAVTGTGAGDKHVWRSIDFGANWTDLGVITASAINSIEYLDNGIAILSDTTRVYRSTNFGANWTDLGGGVFAGVVARFTYLGNGIVMSVASGATSDIQRSIDYGLTWTVILDIPASSTECCYLGNGIVIVTANDGHIWRSINYGLNWTDLGAIIVGIWLTSCYLGNGIVIAGTTAGDLFRTDISFKGDESQVLLERPVTIVNASVTIGISHSIIIVDSPGANRIITLKTAVLMTGHEFTIVNIATGCIVTIATTGGETINGYLNPTLDIQWQSMTVVSNGVNWVII